MEKDIETICDELALEIIRNGNITDRLRFWWCNHYNRPFLDPLFNEYTIEQLLLEFYALKYLKNPSKIKEKDTIEKAKIKGTYISDEDWFKKEMGDDYVQDSLDDVDVKFGEDNG